MWVPRCSVKFHRLFTKKGFFLLSHMKLEDAILPLMLNNCKMSTGLNQYLSNCQL
jgi:hypothetical protein